MVKAARIVWAVVDGSFGSSGAGISGDGESTVPPGVVHPCI